VKTVTAIDVTQHMALLQGDDGWMATVGWTWIADEFEARRNGSSIIPEKRPGTS
jgi:hypothetical protein